MPRSDYVFSLGKVKLWFSLWFWSCQTPPDVTFLWDCPCDWYDPRRWSEEDRRSTFRCMAGHLLTTRMQLLWCWFGQHNRKVAESFFGATERIRPEYIAGPTTFPWSSEPPPRCRDGPWNTSDWMVLVCTVGKHTVPVLVLWQVILNTGGILYRPSGMVMQVPCFVNRSLFLVFMP